MIETKDDVKRLLGDMARRQGELVREGHEIKAARQIAQDEIAARLSPPITGNQLAFEIGRAAVMLFPRSKDRPQKQRDYGDKTLVAKYRAWCENHPRVMIVRHASGGT